MTQKAKRKRVLITRQYEQSGSFVNQLSHAGHSPFLLPMIDVCQLCPQIEYGKYEVLLFTSANAVKYFTPYHDNVRAHLYVAVGSKTAQAMENYLGVSADMTPTVYNMEHVRKLLSKIKLEGARILSPGAKERLPLELDEFIAQGAQVITPEVYVTHFAEYPRGYVDRFIKEHKIEVVTLCSPSAAKSFLSQFRGDINTLDIVSIGTTTAEYLSSRNILTRFPDEFTTEGIVNII